MENLGKNIRLLQMQRKMSQDQLAESLHVTRQTVSNYETGRSRPDVEMLTTLAAALDADVKEILYAPADREAHVRRLRRLVASAVVAALLGILETAGLAWGRQLMQKSYIPSVSYLVVYFVHPLFYLLLGWTLVRGCLVLLRTEPLNCRWAVWSRWVLLAIMAVWLVVMAPFFLYVASASFQMLYAFYSHQSFSQGSGFSPNVIQLFVYRHPKAIAWGYLLWGCFLRLLGLPSLRSLRNFKRKTAGKSDSPE